MVEGVKAARPDSTVSLDDLILWNGYEELTDYWFPTVASTIYQLMDGERSGGAAMQTYKHFCNGAGDHRSAFIATGSYTQKDKTVMAHNGFTPFENGNYLNVIAYIVPKQGYRFIMQT